MNMYVSMCVCVCVYVCVHVKGEGARVDVCLCVCAVHICVNACLLVGRSIYHGAVLWSPFKVF